MSSQAPGGLEEAEANAEFIVRACNSHGALLAALEGLVAESIKALGRMDPNLRAPLIAEVDIARKAIEDAKR